METRNSVACGEHVHRHAHGAAHTPSHGRRTPPRSWPECRTSTSRVVHHHHLLHLQSARAWIVRRATLFADWGSATTVAPISASDSCLRFKMPKRPPAVSGTMPLSVSLTPCTSSVWPENTWDRPPPAAPTTKMHAASTHNPPAGTTMHHTQRMTTLVEHCTRVTLNRSSDRNAHCGLQHERPV